ncbi:hypothetical protein MPER_02063 [Moniliophthora perniciosa FA553]|nr:hypothetical protein MPER_02063 [Moniliophthora perniciosa FA553]
MGTDSSGLKRNWGHLYDNILKYLRATTGRSWRTSLTKWFKKEVFDEVKKKPTAPPPSDASSEGSELMLDIDLFADEESEEEGEGGTDQSTNDQPQAPNAPQGQSQNAPQDVPENAPQDRPQDGPTGGEGVSSGSD